MSNRLANSTSPYLLQHAENPVDWYPWGEDAFAAARTDDKPIFLSIGYSACHWCHVMAHESFESEAIAEQLRADFISMKVDREERPEIDSIYMTALQIFMQMIGSHQGGGWPLSMFLTPEGKPFYGGTYWPPESRMGRTGFADVLKAIASYWRDRREETLSQAEKITGYLRAHSESGQQESPEGDRGDLLSGEIGGPSRLSEAEGVELLRNACANLERAFDPQFGGFGGAPKFPHPIDLRLLLRCARRFKQPRLLDLVTHTLDRMAAGGIYDQLGGGFHRYSVDERWLVPHFEKMLYDNGMLAATYLEAYQVTGNERYAHIVRATLDYILREMTDPGGGFYSAQDADSEGVEGKFFVWTPAELNAVLGEDVAARFAYVYDVSQIGNFEGKNILHLPRTWEQCATLLKCDVDELQSEMAVAREKLLAARGERIWPGLDDKVLINWNALAIEAFALAGSALGEERYMAAAKNAADFILRNMRDSHGRLLHSWRQGQARYAACLDDYACLINALQRLYEATLDERYIDDALALAETTVTHFADKSAGDFFYTADDHEQLITRQKDAHDNPTPSGNGMLATALLRVGQMTGRTNLIAAAQDILSSFRDSLQRMPMATGQLLTALDWALGPTKEIVITAKDQPTVRRHLADLQTRFLPNCLIAAQWQRDSYHSDGLSGLFSDKPPSEEPTVYVCQNFACQTPVSGNDDISKLWNELAPDGSGSRG
ncbi:MAG: thioredoxin domain-containing protein [Pirellulales bacterium]|nr:thioredoxin domain-containing protein [Pirellulales bacterium]